MAVPNLLPVNPAPPSPFVDRQGLCTVAAQALMNQLTAEHNMLALSGFTGTISLAKLTTGGANGSITVQNGIIIGVVQPT